MANSNQESLRDKIYFHLSKSDSDRGEITPQRVYQAFVKVLMDEIRPIWEKTDKAYVNKQKLVYFSIEILLGRLLNTNMRSFYQVQDLEQVFQDWFGMDWKEIEDVEAELPLGSGGLGRLFACFLDSIATLKLPGCGMTLLYRFGLFDQIFRNGWQMEQHVLWSYENNPWIVPMKDKMFTINIEGRKQLKLLPLKIPIIGFENEGAKLPNINSLYMLHLPIRENWDITAVDSGDPYWKIRFLDQLYPNSQYRMLVQEAILSIGGLRMLLTQENFDLENLVLQINDTHPSLLVPEVIRIALDERHLEWAEAIDLARYLLRYTNHTIRPEALEQWPQDLLAHVLPRHAEIINYLADENPRIKAMDFAKNQEEAKINMADMAITGTALENGVNGVAQLHSKILKEEIFASYTMEYPDKFYNVTNGVTHRRWIKQELQTVLDDFIGTGYKKEYRQLGLIIERNLHNDPRFLNELKRVKQEWKLNLSNQIWKHMDFKIDPLWLFDRQTKRMVEYKRQLLNIMHILMLHFDMLNNPTKEQLPRFFIIGGKAARSYAMAKTIIKLANFTMDMINKNSKGKFKGIFLPNYNTIWAEHLFPGSDIGQHISLAGQEASGTGNFKDVYGLSKVVGTADGANIEIAETVGYDNCFLFGTTVEELKAKQFDSMDVIKNNPLVQEVMEFLKKYPEFKPIHDQLTRQHDPWGVLRDVDSYYNLMESKIAPQYYNQQDDWFKGLAWSLGRSSNFSSDRSIEDYNSKSWHLKPVEINRATTDMMESDEAKDEISVDVIEAVVDIM